MEINGGVLTNSHAFVADALSALNDLGLNVAMDNFCTGHASLSYLRSCPFGTLKITPEFNNDMSEETVDRELANSAISKAH